VEKENTGIKGFCGDRIQDKMVINFFKRREYDWLTVLKLKLLIGVVNMNPLGFLSGWKSFLGGIGLVGLGVYELTQGDIQGGIAHIGEGLAIIGIAHKIEKAKK